MSNKFTYKSLKLKNGLRVILSPLKQTRAVTLLILLPVGSRYENKNNNGVSHFIEHLFFKGTKKRPNTIDIAKELDAVGAEYNAFTAKDHTGYYIKLNADKIELAFDMLSDMLFNSRFDPQEIERERGVIIEEINMYEDNPLMYIGDLFESVIYPDSTLGWNIAGPKKVIRQISAQAIKNYRNKFYTPNKMILGLAGNYQEQQAKKLLKKYFLIKAKQPAVGYRKFTSQQSQPQVKVHYKKTEQIQLCLGFPGLHYNHPDNFALLILAIILGGTMSSRLFIEVRERRGLAYFIKSGINTYQDTGNFYIQAGLDRKRIPAALKVIFTELGKVKQQGVTKEELKRAKEHLKGKIILELENSEVVTSWFVKQALFKKKILTPKQTFAKLEAVSLKKIQNLSIKLFLKPKLNLAVIGPYKKPTVFKELINKNQF